MPDAIGEAFVTLRPEGGTKFETEARRMVDTALGRVATTGAGVFGGLQADRALQSVRRFAAGTIAEQREAQLVQRQTEAVLKSTGAAAGATAAQVGKLANSLSKVAGIDDELIQSGENVLLTFTRIRNVAGQGNNIFDRTTKAALDLSVALGQDFQGSIIQVGKALNDPIRGVTALQRVGVSFTASQREQIKTLTESGRLLDAQKIILRELTTEFGGAAAAGADPLQKFSVSVKNMQESIGGALVPALNNLVKIVGPVVDSFSAMPSSMQTAIVGFGALATAAAGGIIILNRVRIAIDGLELASGRLGTAFAGLGSIATPAAALAVLTLGVDQAENALTKFLHGKADVAAMGEAIVDFSQKGRASGELTKQFGANLDDLGDKIKALSQAPFPLLDMFQSNSADQVRDARHDIDALDKSLAALVSSGNTKAAKVAFQQLANVAEQQGISVQRLRKVFNDYTAALHVASAAQKLANAGMAEGASIAAISKARMEDFTDLLNAQDAQQRTADAIRDLNDALTDTSAQAKKATKPLEIYSEAVDRVFGSFLNSGDAKTRVRDAIKELNDLIAGGVESPAKGDISLTGILRSVTSKVEAQVKAGKVADTLAARQAAINAGLQRFAARFPQYASGINKILGAPSEFADAQRDALRQLVESINDEIPALQKNGEIANTSKAAHAELVKRIEALKKSFPGLTAEIDAYARKAAQVPELPLERPEAGQEEQIIDRKRRIASAASAAASAVIAEVGALQKSGQIPNNVRSTHQALVDRLRDMARLAPGAAGSIEEMIRRIDVAFGRSLALNPTPGFAGGGGGDFRGHGASGSWGPNDPKQAKSVSFSIEQKFYGDVDPKKVKQSASEALRDAAYLAGV